MLLGQLLFASLSFTAPPHQLRSTKLPAVARSQLPRMDGDSDPLETVKKSWGRFQDARNQGYSVKQALADVVAGEYDVDAVQTRVQVGGIPRAIQARARLFLARSSPPALSRAQEEAKSAPLVLFTWEVSPSCKKALELLEVAGAKPKVIRLDQPWSEGNKKRAALGRLTGKSSVPSVWIGGRYVGGCDDGPSDTAPGLVKLAFSGRLNKMLDEAGALKIPAPLPASAPKEEPKMEVPTE